MANTTFTIRPAADGNQYSQFPLGNFTPALNIPGNFTAAVNGPNVTISFTDTNSGQAQTQVWRSSDAGFTFSLAFTIPAGTTTGVDSSLNPGPYVYKIRAAQGSSFSDFTNNASVTVAGTGNWQLATGHFETAKIPIEIIAPRAGLTTDNRYYKAYPGIEYKVPVAVLGGAWPFLYELVNAPSSMTIGQQYGQANYGIITWSNPVTSGSPHTVAIRVTDQQGAIATVTYTITVTTAGFLFVDATSGNNANAGTLASPMQNMNGWYKSLKNDATYAGYFVYYRTGTYSTGVTYVENGLEMPCVNNNKPKVHMAYPGENATIDLSVAFWLNANSQGNYWWQGFRWTGIGVQEQKGILWDSGAGVNDIVVYANTFAITTTGTSGSNPSVLFSALGGGASLYTSIIGNVYEGTPATTLFLAYYTHKGVIEGNSVTNNTGSANGFYLKSNNQYWSVRNNVGLAGNASRLVEVDTWGAVASDIEVCWNNYRTTDYGIGVNHTGTFGTMWDYRNTWNVNSNTATNTATGTWNATRNVVLYNVGNQGYQLDSSSVTINRTDLLAATSGLINESTGKLVSTYITSNYGTHGFEVA